MKTWMDTIRESLQEEILAEAGTQNMFNARGDLYKRLKDIESHKSNLQFVSKKLTDAEFALSSLSHVSTAKHIQEFVNNAIKELDNILEEIAKVDPRYGMIIAK